MPSPLLRICSAREVQYVYFALECTISVPTVACSCCGRQWEVQAEEVGCTPSSPVVPDAWYDAVDAEVGSDLMHSNGLSATALSEALERGAHFSSGDDARLLRVMGDDE